MKSVHTLLLDTTITKYKPVLRQNHKNIDYDLQFMKSYDTNDDL